MVEFARKEVDDESAALRLPPIERVTEIATRGSKEAMTDEIMKHIVASGLVLEIHHEPLAKLIASQRVLDLEINDRLFLCAWNGNSKGQITAIDGHAIGWLGRPEHRSSDREVHLADGTVVGNCKVLLNTGAGDKGNLGIIRLRGVENWAKNPAGDKSGPPFTVN